MEQDKCDFCRARPASRIGRGLCVCARCKILVNRASSDDDVVKASSEDLGQRFLPGLESLSK